MLIKKGRLCGKKFFVGFLRVRTVLYMVQFLLAKNIKQLNYLKETGQRDSGLSIISFFSSNLSDDNTQSKHDPLSHRPKTYVFFNSKDKLEIVSVMRGISPAVKKQIEMPSTLRNKFGLSGSCFIRYISLTNGSQSLQDEIRCMIIGPLQFRLAQGFICHIRKVIELLDCNVVFR